MGKTQDFHLGERGSRPVFGDFQHPVFGDFQHVFFLLLLGRLLACLCGAFLRLCSVFLLSLSQCFFPKPNRLLVCFCDFLVLLKPFPAFFL